MKGEEGLPLFPYIKERELSCAEIYIYIRMHGPNIYEKKCKINSLNLDGLRAFIEYNHS